MDETNTIPEQTDTAPAIEGAMPEVNREPTLEELASQLAEYAKTKPVPDWRDGLPDLRWFQAHRFDPEIRAHLGDYVAILNGRMVGAGNNRLKLKLECAKKFGVHPARVLVEWVDDGRDLRVTLLDGFVELPLQDTDGQDSP